MKFLVTRYNMCNVNIFSRPYFDILSFSIEYETTMNELEKDILHYNSKFSQRLTALEESNNIGS